MAVDCTFSFEGLDELRDDLQKMLSRYPDETEKEVYRLAGVFTKDVNAKMPGSYSQGKHPIPKAWHRSREKGYFGGYTVGIEIENTAPHWHLVENGHTVKADPKMYAAYTAGRLDHTKSKRTAKSRSKNPNLRVLGWAPGKGYCLQTRAEWGGGVYQAALKKFLDKMAKGHNL